MSPVEIGALALAVMALAPLGAARADFIAPAHQDDSKSAIPLDFSKPHFVLHPQAPAEPLQIHPFAESHTSWAAETSPVAGAPAVMETDSSPMPVDPPPPIAVVEVHPMLLQPPPGSLPEPSALAILAPLGLGFLIHRRAARGRAATGG